MLGNRQLVSVFFVVVILLGAFFMMGYVVGRGGSTTSVNADGSVKTPPPAKSAPPERATTSDAGQPDTNQAPSQEQTAAEVKKPSPIPSEGPTRAEPVREELSKAIAAKPENPEPEKTKPVDDKPSASEPRRGQKFLQVAATSRADAEIVAETLAKRGFKTTLAPVPDSKWMRVLVGPLKDAADLADTRARLEAASMKPIVREYK